MYHKLTIMIRILLLITCFHLSTVVFSQWSNDPANPLIVYADIFQQTKPTILSDGESGFYVFWIDGRSGIEQVYGQHLDADGIAQWETGGRQFSASSNPVTIVQAELLNDNSVMVVWTGYSDSILANILGADGLFSLPEDVVVAGPAAGIWGSNGSAITTKSYGDGCYISYVLTGYGYDDLYLSKVTSTGDLTFGYNGVLVRDCGVGSAGNLHLLSDGAGGGFISWEYYGAWLQHFDATGALTLGSPTQVTTCTGGIGGTYAGHPYYGIHSDGAGGFMSAWTSFGRDVYAAKINSTGNLAWPDSCRPIFTDPYIQEGIAFSGDGEYHYVSWQDSNPDAPGIYMQKFDASGNSIWATPLMVEDTSLYIPVIKSVITFDGEIAVFYNAGGAFFAQKVRPDGSTLWPQPIEVLSSFYEPFYTEFELIPTTDNNVIGVGRTFDAQDIVAFNLNFISGDTLVEDTTTTFLLSLETAQIHVTPNPVQSTMYISINNPSLYDLHIFNLQGQESLYINRLQSNTVDVSFLLSGMYTVVVRDSAGNTQTGKIVKL